MLVKSANGCGGHPAMCRKTGFRDYLRVSCSPRKFRDTGSRREQLGVEKRGHRGGMGAKASGNPDEPATACKVGACPLAGKLGLAGNGHRQRVQYFCYPTKCTLNRHKMKT